MFTHEMCLLNACPVLNRAFSKHLRACSACSKRCPILGLTGGGNLPRKVHWQSTTTPPYIPAHPMHGLHSLAAGQEQQRGVAFMRFDFCFGPKRSTRHSSPTPTPTHSLTHQRQEGDHGQEVAASGSGHSEASGVSPRNRSCRAAVPCQYVSITSMARTEPIPPCPAWPASPLCSV